MKKQTLIVLFCLLLTCQVNSLMAQDACVHCNASNANGSYASAIGNQTTASGNHSFAGGYQSMAEGSNSFAFGYNSKASQSTTVAIGNTAQATGVGSFALGNYVKATAQNAMAIGGGTTASYPLTNSTANSIAFGVNSNKPTLLVTKATGNNYTGKVAIGPLTSPQTKLHVKADSNEDAGLFLEPSNKTARKAFIQLFDNTHLVSVDKSGVLALNAGTGAVSLSGDHYCLGKASEKKVRVHAGDHAGLYHNVNRTESGEIRDGEGTAYAIEFNNDALQFKTAENQSPRGSAITNWKRSLLLNANGTIGIGSKTTYLENCDEARLIIHSPAQMDLQSGQVTLKGKVGINTVNDVDDYALAVNGGILSTKVFIKEVNQWPDHVFSEDYDLLPLDALNDYIETHHHLPGIPSEAAVIQNGYDLHEMQALLLEKVEELTRYLFVLKADLDALQQQKAPSGGSVQFTYDRNGNRISRSLLFKRIDLPETPSQEASAPTPPSAFSLFPNPTPGQFAVVLQDGTESARFHALLMTENGVLLETRDITGQRTDFDLSRHPQGLYLLEIEGPQGMETWKIIKR